MERSVLLAMVAIGFSLAAGTPRALEAKRRVIACDDGETEIRIKQVKRRSKGLNKKARRTGVHILDLGESGKEKVSAWRSALGSKNWCEVNSQVQSLESLIDKTEVGEAGVRGKAERVDRWVSGTLNGGRAKKASKLIGGALRDIDKGKFETANDKLNKVLPMLTGSRELLDLPRTPLKTAAPQRTVDVSDIVPSASEQARGVLNQGLAIESCPELEQGEPSNGELASIFETLRSKMAAEKFRAVDFKYGPELFEIMVEEGRDGSRGRAATAACVLLTRIEETSIGIGGCQGRFSRVNELRDERGVPAASESRFTALVRQASDEIAQRKFPEAFSTLDELLILLGDPVDQSRDIP